MNNVDATFDFLEQYTEALILAAFEEVKKKHSLNLNVPELQQDHLMNFILDQIVDDFALPSLSSEWNTDEDIFKCKECGKTYKKVAALRKHRKEKHGPGKGKSARIQM